MTQNIYFSRNQKLTDADAKMDEHVFHDTLKHIKEGLHHFQFLKDNKQDPEINQLKELCFN